MAAYQKGDVMVTKNVLIPEIVEANTAREAVEAAKKAHEKDPECGAIEQLDNYFTCKTLRFMVQKPVGVVGDDNLGLAIVDALDWLRKVKKTYRRNFVPRFKAFLDLIVDARDIPSVAKEMLILTDHRARKLLVAVHDGKVKPFRGSRRNQGKIRLLEKLENYGLILLCAIQEESGTLRYYLITPTKRGKELVRIIRDIEQTAPR